MMKIFYIIIVFILGIFFFRKLKLFRDYIPNPSLDPFLAFAEQQRKRGKQMFSPWVTQDSTLLSIASHYFSSISLPDLDTLEKPDITSVKVEPMTHNDHLLVTDQENYFIAVGGPPAAMVAFDKAKKGQRVLYINNQEVKNSRPIWAGAANHGEPDVLTEAPAFISGQHPLKFLWQECKRFVNPSRFNHEVLRDDYPWLTLNTEDWLIHPLQILAGFRVAWGNFQLAKRYKNLTKQGKTTDLYQALRERAHGSGDYLETFNIKHRKILRDPRGSLIIAPDKTTWSILLKDKEKLERENRTLVQITDEEAKSKYGFKPRNAFGLMDKTHDFVFEPNFLDLIIQEIKSVGGIVIKNWHLTRILINATSKQESVLEFCEMNPIQDKKFHYKKFIAAHLSLGSTLYDPNPYDLVSITGVSINALVFGVKFSGGPIICGGKGNHVAVVPLAEPIKIHGQDVSFIRIAAGGCVGPLNRTKQRWHTYSGQTAVNALHCLRKTLPLDADLKVLSVIGCNRVIGKDGRQVELNPYIYINNKKMIIPNITIQMGAGGGGLTQMGAVAGWLY